MYEFLVLAKLTICPMHGYMIAGIIGNIMGPFRRVRWGALYPVLNRLEQGGLIRVVENGEGDGRSRKVYAITEAGRRRLHELLMDTEQHLGEYDTLFPQKVTLFHELSREERLHLSRHYAVYAQQNIDYLVRKRREMQGHEELTPEQLENILRVMDHRIDYWSRERAWAEKIITEQQTLTKEAI